MFDCLLFVSYIFIRKNKKKLKKWSFVLCRRQRELEQHAVFLLIKCTSRFEVVRTKVWLLVFAVWCVTLMCVCNLCACVIFIMFLNAFVLFVRCLCLFCFFDIETKLTMYAWMACMYVCMYVIYVCTNVCIYVCIYVCMYYVI